MRVRIPRANKTRDIEIVTVTTKDWRKDKPWRLTVSVPDLNWSSTDEARDVNEANACLASLKAEARCVIQHHQRAGT